MAQPDIVAVTSGDLFQSDANVLVNAVNIVGVMGAGIAKAFRDKYPEIMPPYQADCRAGRLVTGTVAAYETRNGDAVLCFPTKAHWRQPSRLEYIAGGLEAMIKWTQERDGSDRIAIPPLGCGLGGLDWNEVLPLITDAAARMNAASVIIYTPAPFPSRWRKETSVCRK